MEVDEETRHAACPVGRAGDISLQALFVDQPVAYRADRSIIPAVPIEEHNPGGGGSRIDEISNTFDLNHVVICVT